MNLKPYLIWLTLLFSIFEHGHAQNLELMRTFWSDFRGNIGNKEIVLSLWPDSSNMVKGNYCDLTNGIHKVEVRGMVIGSTIELTEFENGEAVGYFSGVFKEEFDGKTYLGSYYIGVWSNHSKTVSMPFKLFYETSSGGSYEHRYMDLYGTNEMVETFIKKIKDAIVEDNRIWLANNMDYPIKVSVAKKDLLEVANEAQFMELYDKIFPLAYREEVKSYRTCNLFVQSNGVMFGKGEIWVRNKQGSTTENIKYAIAEIHAYF